MGMLELAADKSDYNAVPYIVSMHTFIRLCHRYEIDMFMTCKQKS